MREIKEGDIMASILLIPMVFIFIVAACVILAWLLS